MVKNYLKTRTTTTTTTTSVRRKCDYARVRFNAWRWMHKHMHNMLNVFTIQKTRAPGPHSGEYCDSNTVVDNDCNGSRKMNETNFKPWKLASIRLTVKKKNILRPASWYAYTLFFFFFLQLEARLAKPNQMCHSNRKMRRKFDKSSALEFPTTAKLKKVTIQYDE